MTAEGNLTALTAWRRMSSSSSLTLDFKVFGALGKRYVEAFGRFMGSVGWKTTTDQGETTQETTLSLSLSLSLSPRLARR